MALIFNLFIYNQNCNSDPFLTKLGFTCATVLLENKLATTAVILTTSQCYTTVCQCCATNKDALWIIYLRPLCLIWLAKTILDQGNEEHMWKC